MVIKVKSINPKNLNKKNPQNWGNSKTYFRISSHKEREEADRMKGKRKSG